jgi:two-component system, NtrC family, sensor histidine kinase PilS
MKEGQSRFSALMDSGVGSSVKINLRDRESGMPRLWRGFMAARILVAAVLFLLLLYLRAMGQPPQSLALLVCIAYLVLTVWVRVLGKPSLPGARFDPQWLSTIGVDVLVFGSLLYLQVGGINFAPLFALPVLLASVLGPLLLGLGTAAAVTLTLLLEALQYGVAGTPDAVNRYVQAAITGIGLFVAAYLTNQMATRLIRQERVARGSEMAARAQIQVNQLVIENLGDGVLVIDANGVVHAANPSAREMLGAAQGAISELARPPFALTGHVAWQSLADIASQSLKMQQAISREAAVADAQGSQRQLHVKTYLSSAPDSTSQGSLCVMFMEDLREVEARVRTEKLASMGRMSAAVAHEIRNPLSAISQANALLSEEITDLQQLKLVLMVAQNVQRLNRVVEDVLDVSRVQGGAKQAASLRDAARFVGGVCNDWELQNKAGNRLLTLIKPAASAIEFEADHLRRVLVNLLDNALRHASMRDAAIQVSFQSASHGAWFLSVWSDGEPMESGVQRHLFEPFFSSQSRSSGLGLYICRELCIRHGAVISYSRTRRSQLGQNAPSEGNDFAVLLRGIPDVTQPAPLMPLAFSASRF